MKTNNMLIALYFAVSVTLLSFTRTMAEDEEDLILGEQLNVASTPSSTDPKSGTDPSSQLATEKDRTAQSADPVKTTTTIKTDFATGIKESKAGYTAQDKESVQKLE